MTLLELVQAMVSEAMDATQDVGANVVPARWVKYYELRGELHRRLKLAEADHPIMWRSHLDDTENSQRRQRRLIEQHAADAVTDHQPYPIGVEYCRKDLG